MLNDKSSKKKKGRNDEEGRGNQFIYVYIFIRNAFVYNMQSTTGLVILALLLTLGSKDELVGNDAYNSEGRQDDTKESVYVQHELLSLSLLK